MDNGYLWCEVRAPDEAGEVRKAIAESAGLISGGGSLLQDVTSSKTIPYYLGIIKLAQWLGKPVFIYSQGIGPVNRKLFHPLIRSVFRKCAYISVRDEQSRQLLQSMGISQDKVEVVPDPVMGLTLPEERQGNAETEPGLGDGVALIWRSAHTMLASPCASGRSPVRSWTPWQQGW